MLCDSLRAATVVCGAYGYLNYESSAVVMDF